jgi:hypothetical protein
VANKNSKTNLKEINKYISEIIKALLQGWQLGFFQCANL